MSEEPDRPRVLEREEYIEQAYFFRALRERLDQGVSTQELIKTIAQEILSTTKLPLALDFMVTELRFTGGFSTAMARLGHYFTAFQTYVIREAEREDGRLDFRIALEILEKEAEYRAKGADPQGVFLYQFETLCRNRLGYDAGLEAMARDPIYDENWKDWILSLRRQVGLVDIADMIFVRSQYYQMLKGETGKPVLFGEKEGKIALANRRKDPLYLFSALSRHLGYPSVPRPRKEESVIQNYYAMLRRLEQLERRVKLLEEEHRGGIDLSQFYVKPEDQNNAGK
ncbi:MAG: hypothetical protein WBH86_00430 [Thermogutta sp.]|nr:hypothetical protein [Thermogutta sp.]HPU06945.1 hypothetical protein [Thermogutta sp.]HPZ82607.1 hypothetical protein [Thermogutta sp.]HQF13790.1 hypothetical protein [Thermogutta sp.]